MTLIIGITIEEPDAAKEPAAEGDRGEGPVEQAVPAHAPIKPINLSAEIDKATISEEEAMPARTWPLIAG